MKKFTYNLVSAKWLTVLDDDWSIKHYSLVDLFRNWDTLRGIEGDNPGTTLAIYRWLIALLLASGVTPYDWIPDPTPAAAKVLDYLNLYAEHFDIADPDRPFGQDVTIEPSAAGPAYQSYLIQGDNTQTVFCHEHRFSHFSLAADQAARLLIRLQCFDVAGCKSGSNEQAKQIPLVDPVNFLIQGENLAQTLLYNLGPSDLPGYAQYPIWSRVSSSQPCECRTPEHRLDYLTFRYRRVKFFWEGDRVSFVASHKGDYFAFDAVDMRELELGFARREYQRKATKTKEAELVRFTLKYDPDVALWRNAHIFLGMGDQAHAAGCFAPGICEWVSELPETVRPRHLNIQAFGLIVDKAKPKAYFQENFWVHGIFRQEHVRYQALIAAIAATEAYAELLDSHKGTPYALLADVLKKMPKPLATSLGGKSMYWSSLDSAFALLLEDMTNAIQPKDLLDPWYRAVERVAKNSFISSIRSISDYEARGRAIRLLHVKAGVISKRISLEVEDGQS